MTSSVLVFDDTAHQDGDRPAAGIGPFTLSLWAPCPFVMGKSHHRTALHFMMEQKALLFGNEAARNAMRGYEFGAQVQAAGRRLLPFDSARWAAAREAIVEVACVEKFRQNAAAKEYLVSTAPALLAHRAPRDKLWSIGLPASKRQQAQDPSMWTGQNRLGVILMRVRDQLR